MQTSLTRIFRLFSALFLLLCLPLVAEEPPVGDAEAPVEAAPAVPAPHRASHDWPENPKVFFIRVDQEIGEPQLFILRRGVQRALAQKADALVLLMDTPGGRIDTMREIVSLIIDLDIPTYTLVEADAFSAGAIIALATDHVFMLPRTVIGDAMPVMAGPDGYKTLGDAEREKIESGMDAIVRSIAQHKGRDEMLIRAMVRRELEFKLEDGTVISEKGNILTLTNIEAERILPNGKPLLSEGTVESLDEMLALVGLDQATRLEEIPTWADGLALFITRIAPLLLMAALGLFYLEVNSPGIGWMGVTSVILFVIVMFGHNVAGLSGMEDMLLIVIGMLLILVEIVFIPGFGFVGLLGGFLLLWGMLQAMISRNPGNPGDLPGLSNFSNLGPAVTTLGLACIGAGVLLALFLRSLGDNDLFGKKLVLANALESSAATNASLRSLVGETGQALTPLSPSGTVLLHGNEMDALSDGDYVDAGSAVQVTDISGARLVVSKTT